MQNSTQRVPTPVVKPSTLLCYYFLYLLLLTRVWKKLLLPTRNSFSDVKWVVFSRISGQAQAVPLFRPATAKLHWREVQCQGEEADLLRCPKISWNGGECASAAAVTCHSQQGNYFYRFSIFFPLKSSACSENEGFFFQRLEMKKKVVILGESKLSLGT